jgi:predicted NAD/FAD-binding protein
MTSDGTHKVAVIGGGIAGLASAWFLTKRSDSVVTVYEKNAAPGGHAETLYVNYDQNGRSAIVPVNPAYDIFNRVMYPQFVSLLDELGLPSESRKFTYTYTYSGDGDEPTWTVALPATRDLRHGKQFLDRRFLRLTRELARFGRSIRTFEVGSAGRDLTFAEFLEKSRVPPEYRSSFFYPLFARPWGLGHAQAMDMPADIVIAWMARNRVFSARPVEWLWNPGGARAYIDYFVSRLNERGASVKTSAGVEAVRRDENAVRVVDSQGRTESFDQLIIATNAQQALNLIEDPTPAEQEILGEFQYQKVDVVAHSDTSLMPDDRRDWSDYNVRFMSKENDTYNTIWFGRKVDLPVFTTSYRAVEVDPDPTLVHGRFAYQMPVFTLGSMRARKELDSIQGNQRTWYAGAYTCDTGHHEAGVQSGSRVAEGIAAELSKGRSTG